MGNNINFYKTIILEELLKNINTKDDIKDNLNLFLHLNGKNNYFNILRINLEEKKNIFRNTRISFFMN